MSILNIEFKKRDLTTATLKDFDAKYYLIVNTASKCGLTPQFEGLEAVHQKYKDNGLVTIGFPCGQFLDQELATADDANQFCKLNYGVTFDLMDKVEVNGDNTTPLFAALKAVTSDEDADEGNEAFAKYFEPKHESDIKWNFTKFLVDKEGNVIKRFGPNGTPDKISKYLETLI